MSHASRSTASASARSASARRAGFRRVLRVFVLAAAASALVTACATLDFNVAKSPVPSPAWPATSFAVFSDAHVFLPELGIGQPAFETIKYDDRKMFEYSLSLLTAAIEQIREARPRFVIIPGDLSKDGEEQVHVAVAKALERLRSVGIPVYVIPGNHDVNNPGAVRFEGDKTIRIPNVTPHRFAEIYQNFGYGDAIERDPHSLAYVVEPEPGLWLLALDACRYDLSLTQEREHTGGSFTRQRLDWLRGILERARSEGKAVMAMMHHGVVEHFPGQRKQFPQYLVEDDEAVSRMLAQYGVRMVFTGHFHAQNIAGAWWNEAGNRATPPSARFIFDIETGSLVTYPSPHRLIQVGEDQVAHVRSMQIESLPEMPSGFTAFAEEYSRKGTLPYVERILMGYGISREEAARIAAPLAEAGIAHYAGDAVFKGQEMYPTKNLSLMGSIVIAMKKDIIEGMWKGEPPHADNNIDIDLSNGTYSRVDSTMPWSLSPAPVTHPAPAG